jgi:hypothetical protein
MVWLVYSNRWPNDRDLCVAVIRTFHRCEVSIQDAAANEIALTRLCDALRTERVIGVNLGSRVLQHPHPHPHPKDTREQAKADVCSQKAEVDEGAGEGADGVSTRVFHRF